MIAALPVKKFRRDIVVGIHALINVHEYHCIAIRMRCWLVDVLFFYSLLKCWQHICASRIDHVRRMTTNNCLNLNLIFFRFSNFRLCIQPRFFKLNMLVTKAALRYFIGMMQTLMN